MGKNHPVKQYNPRTRARRNIALKNIYGISLEQYEEMLEAQGGVCAICFKEEIRRWMSVDHDHVTNELRGLLCDKCNKGLGAFEDNTDYLRSAAQYVERYREFPSGKSLPESGRGLPRGEAHHATTITEADVRVIRLRANSKDKLAHIGRDYGLSTSTILAIAQGKSWAWVEGVPLYVPKKIKPRTKPNEQGVQGV